jgi:hypothetical protein
MAEIIEGKSEDLIASHDFRGRDARVIVFDNGEKSAKEDWLKALRAWMDSHAPVGHFVDDSRESIYSGTLDDPRRQVMESFVDQLSV